MKLVLPALALVFLAGCASMTEAQLEARDYQRMDFRNQFVEDRTRCQAAGRRIVIFANGSIDRNGIPKSPVPYYCT